MRFISVFKRKLRDWCDLEEVPDYFETEIQNKIPKAWATCAMYRPVFRHQQGSLKKKLLGEVRNRNRDASSSSTDHEKKKKDEEE